MFGKKILSIVGLLFVSSQLVYADVCTYDGNNIETLVGSCNGKVYLLNSAGNIIVSESAEGCVDENKCILVNCPSSSCVKSESYNGLITTVDKLFSCTSGECVNVGIAATLDSSNYLVNYIDENNLSVVGNSDGDIVFKTDFNGEYCITEEGIVGEAVTTPNERMNKFCAGDCTIYNCNSGVCTTDLALSCRNAGAPTCNPTKTVTDDENDNQEACTADAYYLRESDIYYCRGGTVICQKLEGAQIPRGYFVNTGVADSYIRCDGTTCDAVTKESITKTDCSGKKPGDLIFASSNYRICNEDRAEVPAAIDEDYKYIIKAGTEYEPNHPFNELTQDISYMVTVEKDVSNGFNIVVGEEVPVGNYIVDADSKIKTVSGGATLIQCTSEAGNCATPSPLPVGFLRNELYATDTAVPYIKCQSGSCTAISPGVESDCSGKKAGEIVKIESVFNICIEDGIEVPLTEDTPIKYMVKINNDPEYTDVSPFSTLVGTDNTLNDKYVMVDVGTDATLHALESKKYRYANAKQRIYDSSSEEGANVNGGICTYTGNMIIEFTIDYCSGDANDYYTKGDSIIWEGY